MSVEFVRALDREIADLKAELAQDVRFVRYRELERIRQLYNDAASIGATRAHSVGQEANESKRQAGRRPSPERARIIEAARAFVLEGSSPTPTTEVNDHLGSLGIVIGGANPLNNLSAMMSSSGLFQSHGRAGWTVRQPDMVENEEENPEVGELERNPDDQRDEAIIHQAEEEADARSRGAYASLLNMKPK